MAFELSGTLNTTSRARRGLLARELPAQLAAHPVHRLAEHRAVGPGEVDQLEHAAAHRPGREPRQLGDPAVLDPDELARLQLAGDVRAEQVERAGLGGHHHPAAQPAHHQRPEAAAVHHGVERAPDGDDQAVRAVHLLERVADLALDRGGLGAGDEVDQHLGVAIEVVKIAPFSTSSRLSSAALMRFPLCAMASGPQRVATLHGCALASTVLPVVE